MPVESIMTSIERASALNALGRQITNVFARTVRPGRLKDLLAGTWQGHPLHPALTDVTIGAWTSALTIEVLGGEKGERAADVLIGVGVLSAVPTAVTGLSELADIIEDDERSLATAHALGNVTAVMLYGLSYAARRRGDRARGQVLSLLGAATVTAAAFLGGHLSFRKGVGVDQTAFEHRPAEWTAVLPDADLEDGKPRHVLVGDADILLYRRDGRIYSLANRCSHRGGPLHKGRVDDDRVRCPWHHSTFRLDDGSIVSGPATAPQPSYETRIREGQIEVKAVT